MYCHRVCDWYLLVGQSGPGMKCLATKYSQLKTTIHTTVGHSSPLSPGQSDLTSVLRRWPGQSWRNITGTLLWWSSVFSPWSSSSPPSLSSPVSSEKIRDFINDLLPSRHLRNTMSLAMWNLKIWFWSSPTVEIFKINRIWGQVWIYVIYARSAAL